MINSKHIRYLSEINQDIYSDYVLVNANAVQDVCLFVLSLKPVTYILIDSLSHILYIKDQINYEQEL